MELINLCNFVDVFRVYVVFFGFVIVLSWNCLDVILRIKGGFIKLLCLYIKY